MHERNQLDNQADQVSILFARLVVVAIVFVADVVASSCTGAVVVLVNLVVGASGYRDFVVETAAFVTVVGTGRTEVVVVEQLVKWALRPA